jgi:hypothetical protein
VLDIAGARRRDRETLVDDSSVPVESQKILVRVKLENGKNLVSFTGLG